MPAGTPTQHKDLSVKGSITVKFDASVDVTGKVAFTLPQGVLPSLSSQVSVATAFNGTTPALAVGTTPDGGALTSGSLFATADTAVATAGVKPIVAATLLAGGFNAPTTAPTDVVLTLTGTGVTTGVAYITIDYTAMPRGVHYA